MTAGATASQGPAVTWAEPFAALYWRIRVQSYLLAAAFVAVTLLGYWLYTLGRDASALVYVVSPDGEALAVVDRRANRLPTPAESAHVARQFISRLYEFNSSRVHQSVAEAVNQCAPATAAQLRAELAESQFVETIRRRRIRSELSLNEVTVQEHTDTFSRVSVAGVVNVFPIEEYEGEPVETKPFNVDVVLRVVPRDPHRRLNGLEVERIVGRAASTTDSQQPRRDKTDAHVSSEEVEP